MEKWEAEAIKMWPADADDNFEWFIITDGKGWLLIDEVVSFRR